MSCSHDLFDDADGGDKGHTSPSAEALLAGTMALMTGHAQACCAGQRALVADKVHRNLRDLAQHPALSAPFRAMLGSLQQRWAEPLSDAQAETPNLPPYRLWHRAHETVQ